MDLFKQGLTLAVIGTSGRGEDKLKLTAHHWDMMLIRTQGLIEDLGVTDLVSGGAAWADHVAVHLNKTKGYPLSLWLPSYSNDIEVARNYHAYFSTFLSRNTFEEVMSLSFKTKGGFKDRNKMVAKEADAYIAMTFGDGPDVKDGGTKHTVDMMDKLGAQGFHLDLNTFELYKR